MNGPKLFQRKIWPEFAGRGLLSLSGNKFSFQVCEAQPEQLHIDVHCEPKG